MLTARLLARDGTAWQAEVLDRFPVAVDSKYVQGSALNYQSTGAWSEQSHLFARTARPSRKHVVFAVLWPEKAASGEAPVVDVTLTGPDSLRIIRPDGRTQDVTLSDTSASVR
jgi:hypothetical protein